MLPAGRHGAGRARTRRCLRPPRSPAWSRCPTAPRSRRCSTPRPPRTRRAAPAVDAAQRAVPRPAQHARGDRRAVRARAAGRAGARGQARPVRGGACDGPTGPAAARSRDEDVVPLRRAAARYAFRDAVVDGGGRRAAGRAGVLARARPPAARRVRRAPAVPVRLGELAGRATVRWRASPPTGRWRRIRTTPPRTCCGRAVTGSRPAQPPGYGGGRHDRGRGRSPVSAQRRLGVACSERQRARDHRAGADPRRR